MFFLDLEKASDKVQRETVVKFEDLRSGREVCLSHEERVYDIGEKGCRFDRQFKVEDKL